MATSGHAPVPLSLTQRAWLWLSVRPALGLGRTRLAVSRSCGVRVEDSVGSCWSFSPVLCTVSATGPGTRQRGHLALSKIENLVAWPRLERCEWWSPRLVPSPVTLSSHCPRESLFKRADVLFSPLSVSVDGTPLGTPRERGHTGRVLLRLCSPGPPTWWPVAGRPSFPRLGHILVCAGGARRVYPFTQPVDRHLGVFLSLAMTNNLE